MNTITEFDELVFMLKQLNALETEFYHKVDNFDGNLTVAHNNLSGKAIVFQYDKRVFCNEMYEILKQNLLKTIFLNFDTLSASCLKVGELVANNLTLKGKGGFEKVNLC